MDWVHRGGGQSLNRRLMGHRAIQALSFSKLMRLYIDRILSIRHLQPVFGSS
jgi:hypothetical protein